MTEVERIVSRADRGRLLFVGAMATICLILTAGLIYATVVNFQQNTKITRVERRSACEGNAGSAECQKVKRESDEAQSIFNTCISFWKVGYPCPKPGSRAAMRAVTSGGGDAQTPTHHHSGQQPGPPKGGHGAKHGGGRAPKHHPHPKSSPPSPAAPAPSPAAPPAPTQPGNSPGNGPSADQGVKACVDIALSACVNAELP